MIHRTILPVAAIIVLVLAAISIANGYMGYGQFLSTLVVALAAVWIAAARNRRQ